MSETCNHDCSSCSQSCESRDPKSFLEKPHEKSTIRKVIGVVSGKGGVGKSMVSSMLAANFQKKGYRTAVMDADITGPSIPKALPVVRWEMKKVFIRLFLKQEFRSCPSICFWKM